MLPLALGAVLAGVLAACWWGSNIVFRPSHKIPLLAFPEQFDLRYEAVSFTASDGAKLKGWLIPAAEPTDRTILLCHGWSDNKGDMLARFRFLAAGFNLFFFDVRGHGESPGSFSTIGYLEARDFDAALLALERLKPAWSKRLGVLGLSMGAAMAIRGLAAHPGLRCAVAEAPFRSFNAVVHQFTRNHFSLPYFPFVWLTLVIIRLRLGADPEPLSPIYHAAASPGRPKLFIAGSEDTLMPLTEVRAVFDAAADPKELWRIEGAAHGRCQETAGGEYERRISEFFGRHL